MSSVEFENCRMKIHLLLLLTALNFGGDLGAKTSILKKQIAWMKIHSHLTDFLPIRDKSTKSRTNSSANICTLGRSGPRQTWQLNTSIYTASCEEQSSPCHTHMSACAPWSTACSPPSILLALTRSMFQPGGGRVGPTRCRALNFNIIF